MMRRMNDYSNPALYPIDAVPYEPAPEAYPRLKPAEKAFVDAYILTLGQSARAAGKAISDVIGKGFPDIDPSERGKWMMKNPLVKQAIAERARELSQKFEVDANSLIKEIANIAFANMGNYLHVGEDGLPYFDFTNVTFAQMSAVKSVTVEELAESEAERMERLARPGGILDKPKLRKKVKLELHDKNNAHDKLMRMLQLYAPERLDVNLNVTAQEATANKTPEELAQIWADQLRVVNE